MMEDYLEMSDMNEHLKILIQNLIEKRTGLIIWLHSKKNIALMNFGVLHYV